MKEPKPLNRKEAIMLGYDIAPKSREEAMLYPQDAVDGDLKLFTRDETFRVNCYERISTEPVPAPIPPDAHIGLPDIDPPK